VTALNFLKFLLALLHVFGDGRSTIDPDGAVFGWLVAEGPIIDPNGGHG
jgi:hypothetical protein